MCSDTTTEQIGLQNDSAITKIELLKRTHARHFAIVGKLRLVTHPGFRSSLLAQTPGRRTGRPFRPSPQNQRMRMPFSPVQEMGGENTKRNQICDLSLLFFFFFLDRGGLVQPRRGSSSSSSPFSDFALFCPDELHRAASTHPLLVSVTRRGSFCCLGVVPTWSPPPPTMQYSNLALPGHSSLQYRGRRPRGGLFPQTKCLALSGLPCAFIAQPGLA